MSNVVLEVRDLGINFGGLRAVDGLNIDVEKNQLYGLIGPNGAGKTTVFNMLTGVYEPSDGTIKLNGELLNKKKPHEIARKGVSRTFQNIRLFKDLTVLENVLIALDTQADYSILTGILKMPKFFRQEKEMEEEAMRLLAVFGLDGDAQTLARNLPYGKQRELEIVRALGTHPKLLLLDEPAAGMNPQETQNLMDAIETLRNTFDISVLLIEHDMKLVMGICEKITVINYGTLLACGTPEEIQKNPQVIKAYLGE
ncbi:MAG: ABC transporter ATP-binding protein [Erysipelotrichaceae bacterium]|nr:ABC transporter ATP-binding protein [Erysipelotrichaceae bacterium]MBR2551901.1 ABC transporter ATP-binding protein [Erysipelotrichaceae bacterium]MDO5439251.1 ABC transporter ATP-binding protein [Erysipelotrichaceae bacterium]